MVYLIKSHGNTNGVNNPLRKIDGEWFYEKHDAVECVWHALWDVINGDEGCEFVMRHFDDELFDQNPDEYLRQFDKYKAEVKEWIWDHMTARHDGWTAEIEEVDHVAEEVQEKLHRIVAHRKDDMISEIVYDDDIRVINIKVWSDDIDKFDAKEFEETLYFNGIIAEKTGSIGCEDVKIVSFKVLGFR